MHHLEQLDCFWVNKPLIWFPKLRIWFFTAPIRHVRWLFWERNSRIVGELACTFPYADPSPHLTTRPCELWLTILPWKKLVRRCGQLDPDPKRSTITGTHCAVLLVRVPLQRRSLKWLDRAEVVPSMACDQPSRTCTTWTQDKPRSNYECIWRRGQCTLRSMVDGADHRSPI